MMTSMGELEEELEDLLGVEELEEEGGMRSTGAPPWRRRPAPPRPSSPSPT